MKRIISLLLLLALLLSMLCGCTDKSDNNSENNSSTAEANGTDTTEKAFEEYAISIEAEFLYIYKEPSYESETIGIFDEKGAYIVVDEVSNTYGGVPLKWAKLKGIDGWIILNYIGKDDYNIGDFSEYTPETEQSKDTTSNTTDNVPSFKSYTFKIRCNSIGVYEKPNYYFGKRIYIIKDKRTVTIVNEVEEELPSGVIVYWGEVSTGGWINIEEAQTIEETPPESENETTTPTEDNSTEDNSTEDTSDTTDNNTSTEKPTEKPTLGGTYIGKDIYGCGNKHTKKVNGKTFVWYDRYERRNTANTETKAYMDISAFDVWYQVYEPNPSKGNNDWYFSFDVKTATGTSIMLWCYVYDNDGYTIGDLTTVLWSDESHKNSIHSIVGPKSKGYGKIVGNTTIDEGSTIILRPHISG